MPASAHTLADSDSACVHVLARKCKEVRGGVASSQGRRARARRHHRQGEGEGKGDGRGKGTSSRRGREQG